MSEAFYGSQHVVNDYGVNADVAIFKNPSAAEFSRLMREFGLVRGMLNAGGDVYVWRGDVLHNEITVPGYHALVWDDQNNFEIGWDANAAPYHPDETWVKSFPHLRRLIGRRRIWINQIEK